MCLGVEVVSGEMFLVPVPKQNAGTLFELLKKYIWPGSIIAVGKQMGEVLCSHVGNENVIV